MKKVRKCSYDSHCMYFTVSSLSRHLNELADRAFRPIELSPSHGHMLLAICDHPGITQVTLSDMLNLKPSTITRLLEKLIKKEYIYKVNKGRKSLIYPTENGQGMQGIIETALNRIYTQYNDILNKDFAEDLIDHIVEANNRFDNAKLD